MLTHIVVFEAGVIRCFLALLKIRISCRRHSIRCPSVVVNTLPRTVVLHPCRRHDIKMTDVVFCLSSSRNTARSALYGQQTCVPSCRRQLMERPSAPHHIYTVTRGFQTASRDFPFFSFRPGHPDMTYLSLSIIIIVFFSGISCGPCNNWHYLVHVKHVDDDDEQSATVVSLQLLSTECDHHNLSITLNLLITLTWYDAKVKHESGQLFIAVVIFLFRHCCNVCAEAARVFIRRGVCDDSLR